MVIKDKNTCLFTKTNILSAIAHKNHIVIIDGPQLIYEMYGCGERTFTGYTDASIEEICNIFNDDSSYEVFFNECSVTVCEKNKGRDGSYIFTLTPMGEKAKSAEYFCQMVIGNRYFSADKIAFEPSTGIIDLCGGWEQFRHGEFEVPDSYTEDTKNDAGKLVDAMNKVIENSCLTLSDSALKAIKQSREYITYASPMEIGELFKTVLKRNPAKIRSLEQTGLLEYIFPELHCAFTVRDNFPDYIYSSLGEGCIATINGIDGKTAWALMFYFAGKAITPLQDFGEFRAAVGFTENAMILANNFLSKLGYNQEYIYDVLSVLFLLDTDIPADYDELLEFIFANFDNKERFESFETARFNLADTYYGSYRNAEMTRIKSLVNIAETIEQAWIRSNINITDEEIEEAVGRENLEITLLKIKRFLADEPMYNDKNNLIAFITRAPDKSVGAYKVKQINKNTAALLEERQQILQKISSIDFEKVNRIAFGRNKCSEEEQKYAKAYFDYSERLSDLNDELLNVDAFSDKEKALVIKCQNVNKMLKVQADEQKFVDSIFNDTDTSFFENIYSLSQDK